MDHIIIFNNSIGKLTEGKTYPESEIVPIIQLFVLRVFKSQRGLKFSSSGFFIIFEVKSGLVYFPPPLLLSMPYYKAFIVNLKEAYLFKSNLLIIFKHIFI